MLPPAVLRIAIPAAISQPIVFPFLIYASALPSDTRQNFRDEPALIIENFLFVFKKFSVFKSK